MNITRLDLDGVGSPTGLAARIFELEPGLTVPIPLEALCERLDIFSIDYLHTEGFAAALITDEVKSSGAILVANGQSNRRRRFSIAHELGHFLIPTHRTPAGAHLLCSEEQLHLSDTKDKDHRRRMEAEANRFAASLLMPTKVLTAELRQIRIPQIIDIIRLATLFDVSKGAMARAYVEFSREAVAIVVISSGRVSHHYRNDRKFPWIAVSSGNAVPDESIYHDGPCPPGKITQVEECEPELWLGPSGTRKVEVLTEQVLHQENGFALIMLHAEILDVDDR